VGTSYPPNRILSTLAPVSRKSRRKARARYRPPVKASAPVAGGGATTAQRSVSQARVGGDQATVRAVEMSLGSSNRILKGRGGRMVVESVDPSIPLDRVPYFSNDLIRLAVVAAAMVVLLGAGAVTIPQLIK
jgi:hypothetical protein